MKRALVSVSDKSGLIPFIQGLVSQEYQIISTGGTRRHLEDAGIQTIGIEEVTQFPEMLDGRVKTLHPLIHGGLLGVLDKEEHRNQMEKHQIIPIDLVCVNLYPFKETIENLSCTVEEAIENIDIGGPSMIRSAAKNHRFVTVVTSVDDYDAILAEIIKEGHTTLKTRQHLAVKAFQMTAEYDGMIQKYLADKFEVQNSEFRERETEMMSDTLCLDKVKLKQVLRYGENPHQSAAFYSNGKMVRYSMTTATQLHGKELSYNNIQDANATLQILKEFEGQPAVVAVKHMNPCGVAIAEDITTAWEKAYEADPISIFGGIVALNEEVNVLCAKQMSEMFLEIILAPSFSKEAFEILSKKKNIRLMTFKTEGIDESKKSVSVAGGLLVQGEDDGIESKETCEIVTMKEATSSQWNDALFGMKVVKHVKSNAIVLVKNGQTVGVGAGQMNRVGAAKIALDQAQDKAKGAVLASDAFFPMRDTVELASEHGIECIIQPGGSIKDQDSIDCCNEKNIAMIFTGKRHFKH